MHSGMKIPALKDNADDLTPTFPFQFFSRSDEQRRQERLVAGILVFLLLKFWLMIYMPRIGVN